MTSVEILAALAKVGALIQDSHIVYTSGRHGSHYVNKDALYPHTGMTSDLCREMATRFKDAGVDIVLAPAVGGIILSQWVAHHLTALTGREILGVYAEKAPVGEGFVIKRGYDKLVAGKKILILEDVITTGISVKRVVEATRALGGTVLGVAALCNRGGITTKELAEVPRLTSLVEINLDSWEEKECPLCAKGIAINTNVGKGLEFLSRRP